MHRRAAVAWCETSSSSSFQSCSRLTWIRLQNPLRPGILLAKALGAMKAFVELRFQPRVIPLSDSFMNGINKLTQPVSCLYFSSQRNEHEFFWKHDIGIKMPTVTETPALVSLPPRLFSCAGSYLVCRRVCGGGGKLFLFHWWRSNCETLKLIICLRGGLPGFHGLALHFDTGNVNLSPGS